MVSIDTIRTPTLEHHLRTEMEIAKPIVEIFDFFSDAANLERITPPWLRFSISSRPPIQMRTGTTIEYRLRLFGMPVNWRTLIPVWNPPYEFVDVQTSGPYALWIHQHRFEEVNGVTVIRDHVRYKLPFGRFGLAAHPVVSAQLRRIFQFRMNAIVEYFGQK